MKVGLAVPARRRHEGRVGRPGPPVTALDYPKILSPITRAKTLIRNRFNETSVVSAARDGPPDLILLVICHLSLSGAPLVIPGALMDRSLSFFLGRGGSGGLIEPVVARVGVLSGLFGCVFARVDVVGGVMLCFGCQRRAQHEG